ncbi:MAG: MBL fold metallo-hydrolase [Firmicutes bacterium]|nr:MBL fold metallo-hydrolase [Bacillota bacterium]
MKMRLIRHATHIVWTGGKSFLIDPMLSEPGAMAPIPDVPNPSGNPLVPLPAGLPEVLGVDAVIVSHVHRDHFDDAAMGLLPKDLPLFCQPGDEEKIAAAGFTDVRPVADSLAWEGVVVSRTGGRHGTGKIGEMMGRVSGFVLASEGEPSIYVAGDTIWCPEVEAAIEEHDPGVIVCYAGAARFASGDPITMTKEDVGEVARKAPRAKVIVIHMESWNHCRLSRKEMKEYIEANSLGGRVVVPGDGEWLTP